MSVRPSRLRARRHLAALTAGAVLSVVVLTGCSAMSDQGPVVGAEGAPRADTTSGSSGPDAPARPAVSVRTNLPRKAGAVPVSTLVKVSASDGTWRSVRFAAAGSGKAFAGQMSEDGTTWTAADRLEPGTRYTVSGVAEDSAGLTRRLDKSFRTEDLTLDQQTYPSIAPLDGETVGVGMPVIVTFDLPVTHRAAIERNLSVDVTPVQQGSWHWISDTEVHWRPRTYWKPGSKVTVHAAINGVDAGNGIYGQESRTTGFTVGDAVIMKVDVASHRMRVLRNGTLLRTLPISAGKPGFTTRSGIKVIIEKFRSKTMDAATTGIDPGDPEYYNIDDVEYAQRVTYSGEFLHAAPWSVGSQGAANVSHGCVGMSTADAAWLYGITHRGDVVDVTGSDRSMEPTNGYGDWNLDYATYRAASALS